jgi:hypothetical protein
VVITCEHDHMPDGDLTRYVNRKLKELDATLDDIYSPLEVGDPRFELVDAPEDLRDDARQEIAVSVDRLPVVRHRVTAWARRCGFHASDLLFYLGGQLRHWSTS